MMANDIDKIVRQTQRYFYEDGLVEMAVGLLFVAVGFLLLIWRSITSPTPASMVLAIGLPALIIGGSFLIKRAIREIKERVTYPRTGYVAYRRGEPARGRWLVIGLSLLLAIAAFFLPQTLGRMPAMVGALLGVILVYLGYRVNVWRFYAVGAIAVILGFGLTFLGASDILGTGLTFIGAGLALFAGGAMAFANYLHQHPKAEEGS